MRYLVASLATFVVVACTIAPVASGQSQALGPSKPPVSKGQTAPSEPPVQFLIESAAADFHSHPPHPTRFRRVRVGHDITDGGAKRYMLYGEFLPAQEKGNAAWTPFVTIKTSGYEQYLGAQAASFCREKITWDKVADLSSSLQSQLESLR